MHSKNDNIEITINEKTEEVMKSMVQERILKNAFSFHVNMKDIIGADYVHAKKFAKILK